MAYATQDDIEKAYSAAALLVAGDRDQDGDVDTGVVAAALDDATDEINSYIAGRYAVPLTTVPKTIRRCCVDIAFYRLSADAGVGTEEKRLRFTDAIKWLKEVATGVVSLEGAEGAAGTSSGGSAVLVSGGGPRLFTRDRQGGIG